MPFQALQLYSKVLQAKFLLPCKLVVMMIKSNKNNNRHLFCKPFNLTFQINSASHHRSHRFLRFPQLIQPQPPVNNLPLLRLLNLFHLLSRQPLSNNQLTSPLCKVTTVQAFCANLINMCPCRALLRLPNHSQVDKMTLTIFLATSILTKMVSNIVTND